MYLSAWDGMTYETVKMGRPPASYLGRDRLRLIFVVKKKKTWINLI